MRNVHGISDEQAKVVMGELAEMMPAELKHKINWEMSEDEGPWLRKIKVSLWFKVDTHLVYMIETMQRMREEMAQKQYKVDGHIARTNLEYDPKSTPFRKATAMFYEALKVVHGDESKIKCIYGALHTTFLAEVGPVGYRKEAEKYTREGQGYAEEGWKVYPDIVKRVCINFEKELYELSLKEL